MTLALLPDEPIGLKAFSLMSPQGEAGPLVFASPHSGSVYPSDMGHIQDLSSHSLRSAEDALVDRLVASAPALGVPVIVGHVSRAYVDLNRAPEELDPGLIADFHSADVTAKVAAGFGVVPRRTGDGAALYDRALTLAEANDRLERVHRPYHSALAELMQAARERHGLAILVDWHSMPSRAVGGTRTARGADIVLGDRHGSSCGSRLTRKLRTLFEAQGWRVGLNQPYAGGYSTQIWGRPSEGFQAVQVELSRALYLNEETLEPSGDFARCQAALARVIAGLCAETWT